MRTAQEQANYGGAEEWIREVDEDYARDMAEQAAGNWKSFESFGWDRASEEGIENWALVYTSNRDSGLLEQANERVIDEVMSNFGEDQVVPETHGHWAVGHVDGYSIKVYDEQGNLTPAWLAWVGLQVALENYPVLDESLYSEMEYEATLENISEVGGRMVDDEAPDDWAAQVFGWFWDYNQRAVENSDEQGGYPSEEEMREALSALGFLDREMVQEEVLEHIEEVGELYVDVQSAPAPPTGYGGDWPDDVYEWLELNDPRSLEGGTPSDAAIYEAIAALGYASETATPPPSQFTSDDPRQVELPFDEDKEAAAMYHKRGQAQATEEEYWANVKANAEGALEVARERGENFQDNLQEAVFEHADSYVIYYSDSFDVLRFTNNLNAADDMGGFPQDDVLAFITMAAFYAFEQDMYDVLHDMGAFREPEGMEYEAKAFVKGAGGVYSEYWPEVAEIAKEVSSMGLGYDEAMEAVESWIDGSSWVSNPRAAVDTIQLSDNEQAILDVGMEIPDNVASALQAIAYFAMRQDVLEHADFQPAGDSEEEIY